MPAFLEAPASLSADSLAALSLAAMAPSTRRAYQSDWRAFESWCSQRGLQALPATPEVVVEWLVDQAASPPLGRPRSPLRPSTLARRVAALDKAHRLAGHPAVGSAPQVRLALAALRRQLGVAPARKAALLRDDIEALVGQMDLEHWPAGVAGWRDRLVLVAGWVGAFRRSELAGLTVGQVTLASDGLRVRLPRSKSDQEGEGVLKALPFARRRPLLCAPCAWAAWMRLVVAQQAGRAAVMAELRGLSEASGHLCADPPSELPPAGLPLLRPVRHGAIGEEGLSGRAVAEIVRRRAAQGGHDPATIGGHSLRAGFVTQAFLARADPHSIMRQSGHRSPAMLEVYAREGAPLLNNAVTRLGL